MLAEMPSSHGPSFLVEFKDLDDELRFLRKVVTEFRAMPQIRDLALDIIRKAAIESRDKKGQALAVANWVKQNIYYVHELPERFQYPNDTLRSRAGDCDDFTTLIGSLIESIGIPSVMVAMKPRFSFKHIFPAARIGAGMLSLDATNRFGVNVNPIDYTRQRGNTSVRVKLA